MKKKKHEESSMHFGFSSIMLSFVMICILTFSALSFITIQSDFKLTTNTSRKSQDYHTAQKLCYEKLALIDQLLSDTYAQTSSKKEYLTTVKEQLSTQSGELTEATDALYFSYVEPINERQELQVAIQISYPADTEEHYYQMQRFQICNLPVNTNTITIE